MCSRQTGHQIHLEDEAVRPVLNRQYALEAVQIICVIVEQVLHPIIHLRERSAFSSLCVLADDRLCSALITQHLQ